MDFGLAKVLAFLAVRSCGGIVFRGCVVNKLKLAFALYLVCLSLPNLAEEERIIEEVEVFGEQTVKDTSIGRNLLDVGEMGRSVQIIDAQLIEEIKPVAIEDILSLSSNLSYLGDNDGRENTFVLRGFQEPPVLRDGFRVESFGGITDPELYNIERIEVLKGPDSILYGESNPGGLINLRLKRPLSEDHAEFAIEAGSNPSVSPRFDIGGGLGDAQSTRYRLVGLYSQDEGWRDFDNDNKRVFLAPSLSWAVSDNTLFTVIAELTEDDFQADFGTAINLQGELIAPPEQVNNHPLDTVERHSRSAGFDLSHEFNERWQADTRFRVIDSGFDYSALLLPFGLDQESLQYFRVPAQQGQDNEEIALQLNLNGDFTIVELRNRLSVGVDYRESTTENSTRFPDLSDPNAPDFLQPAFLDWQNPDYSRLPTDESLIPFASGFYTNEDITRLGLFLQNHLNFTEQFMLSLGARFDDVERDPLSGSSSSAQDYDNTSAQLGLRYDINDATSLFANYSESFSPNFELDKNNNVLDPETGDGYEIGIKGSVLGGQLAYSVAAFDIEKTNVSIADVTALPTDPNPFGSVALGEQTSEGVEIDINGLLTDDWRINFAVGYSNTEAENGYEIVGAADVTGSLWSAYQLSDRWRAGGGIEYVGERLATADGNEDGSPSDPVYLDTHFVINAFVGYQADAWQYQLNITNLTDEEYIDAAWGGLSRSVHPGAPLQALFSVTYAPK